jgi:hypothetical protein
MGILLSRCVIRFKRAFPAVRAELGFRSGVAANPRREHTNSRPNEIEQIGCRIRQMRQRPKSIFVKRVSTSLPSNRMAERPQKPAQNLERPEKSFANHGLVGGGSRTRTCNQAVKSRRLVPIEPQVRRETHRELKFARENTTRPVHPWDQSFVGRRKVPPGRVAISLLTPAVANARRSSFF